MKRSTHKYGTKFHFAFSNIISFLFEYFFYFILSINLYDFAKLLKKFDVVNAINLDGGGSSTFVINETTVNYPSDEW